MHECGVGAGVAQEQIGAIGEKTSRNMVEKHGETRVCGGVRIVGFGWMGGQQQNGA